MTPIKEIIHIIEFLLFLSLGLSAAYLFIFGIAGLFRYRSKQKTGSATRRMAVLIPGYKEDNVIAETARQALEQDYPRSFYDVYIIADSFLPETLVKLGALDVRVIEVSFEQSSKAKALNRAMQEIREDYEVAVILDADNVMSRGFLNQVNDAFSRGFVAIQGHRVAKNTNSDFALLDAISEEVNNRIFRKGHRILGLSSALIGSGMAFDYAMYKETMEGVTSHGEDKELEMLLLAKGIRIEYLDDAIILDEKIQKAEVFARQRRRWLSAQFGMFRHYFMTGLKYMVTRGNFDLFDKVIQMMLPPRVIQLGMVTLMLFLAALFYIFGNDVFRLLFPVSFYLGLWMMTVIPIIVSVPRKYYTKDTLKALGSLPGAFIIMFGLLFKLRGAKKSFIHTPHGAIETHKI